MIFISPYPLSFLLMRIVLVSLEGHPIAAHNRNAKHTGLTKVCPKAIIKPISPSLSKREIVVTCRRPGPGLSPQKRGNVAYTYQP
jgi:hypothetical protein